MKKTPGSIEWTMARIQFMRKNYKKLTNKELADALGLKRTSVRLKLYSMGLKKMELEYWSKEQVQFLIDNYKTMGNKDISKSFNSRWPKKKEWTKKMINKKLGQLKLKRSEEDLKGIIEGHKKNGVYNIGLQLGRGLNKLSIGQTTVHRLPNGDLVQYIKTERGLVKHAQTIWVTANGRVPKGYVIAFKDFNPFNCDIHNLTLEARAKEEKVETFWNEKRTNYLRGLYQLYTYSQIAALLRCSVGDIKRKVIKLGLRKATNSTDSAEVVSYVKDNFAHSKSEEIAKHLNISLKKVRLLAAEYRLKKSPEFLKSQESGRFGPGSTVGYQHRYQKGSIPWSKGMTMPEGWGGETRFKKGQKPHNTKTDGFVSVRSYNKSQQIQYVRISENMWQPLHHFNWISKNGPIPEGYALFFKDGNPLNANLENLELMSLQDRARVTHLKHIENLSDTFIASLLIRQGFQAKLKDLAEHKDLIEAKRLSVLLNRACRPVRVSLQK